MLQLRNITKDYAVNNELTVHALKEVSLDFRSSEFVSVLGPSGCGKTTMLNIIGGLDRYTSGDLIVDGVSTKNFSSSDWDNYRNNQIGFVFQSYNLIPQISVLDNVALSLTFAGVGKSERLARAKAALQRVGLEAQMHKRPNQLSGGQMQRVAIARAIVGDPKIILADEPTGALDSETGLQVMELLKEISRDKLVILVTHNEQLAKKYSSRIVRLFDGTVVRDSAPFTESDRLREEFCQLNPDANGDVERGSGTASDGQKSRPISPKSSKPNGWRKFWAAIRAAFGISLRNLWAKRGRTLLTAFAGSIGIFGIAMVLAISGGMGNYVDYMQTEAVGDSAVTIGETAYSVSRILSVMEDAGGVNETPYPDLDGVVPYQRQSFSTTTTLSDEFIEYIRNMDPSWTKTVNYSYSLNMHVLHEKQSGSGTYSQLANWASNAYQMIEEDQLVADNYNVLAKTDDSETGYPSDMREISLVVDKFNRINPSVLTSIGISVDRDEKGNYKRVLFSDILGKEYTIVLNNGWYAYNQSKDTYSAISSSKFGEIDPQNTVKVKIVSVLRPKSNSSTLWLNTALAYLPELSEYLIANACESDVGKAQIASTTRNVVSGANFSRPAYGTEEEKDANVNSQYISALKAIGAYTNPTNIKIYPKDLDSKQQISAYIEDWNTNHPDREVSYLDITGLALTLMATFIDVVSWVLIAFSAVALVVSTVMISVITYTSVVERTKEIGVLRSIGASKNDVSAIFNAETTMIGVIAGVMGVVVALILGWLVNIVINKVFGVSGIAAFTPAIILGMFALSVLLTLFAGLIPARIAAKRDPVKCLRTE